MTLYDQYMHRPCGAGAVMESDHDSGISGQPGWNIGVDADVAGVRALYID